MQLNTICTYEEGSAARLIDFLCDGNQGISSDDMRNFFYSTIYNNNDPIMFCITKFQNFLRDYYDRGKYITADIIDEKIRNNDLNGIFDCLEELFLEPINRDYYQILLLNAIEMGIDGTCIMKWRIEKNQRHVALLTHPQRGLRLIESIC